MAIHDPMNPVRLMNVLLRRRRYIVGATLLTLGAALVVTILRPRSYTASASFAPQVGNSAISELSGLTAQLGILPTWTQPSHSSAFYADLVRSREILYSAVETPYAITDYRGLLWFADSVARRGNLVELRDMRNGNDAEGTEKGVRWLHDRISVTTDRETGIVTFAVTTRSAELAHGIASRLLELVRAFDVDQRRSQAKNERAIIEKQLDKAAGEVQDAEDSLARFLESNRNFRNSPQLLFQHDRLQRHVSLRQQVLTSLTEAYERARIEEVRNTPVLTVVAPSRLPPFPDPRRLLFKGLLALLAGAALGIGLALWREYLDRSVEAEPQAFAEFAMLKREAAEGVRRFIGRPRPSDD